jgi:ribosomal protein S18 acetylase RimI-like enzyme
MNEILQNMSEQAVIAAIEANLAEEMASFGRYLAGAELHEDPEMQWIITNLFNAVIRTQITTTEIASRLDTTITHFKARKVTSMGWAVSPSTRPADLVTYLQARGFKHLEDHLCMAADLQALHEDSATPANLRINRVSDEGMLKIYAHVSERGFASSENDIQCYYDTYARVGFGEQAPWQHYIGWLDDEPIAVSSLLFHAGVAGIYGVTTVPEARRQGAGAAMTLAALRDARKRGYRLGILTPSDMGLGVYRRIGFRVYYTVRYPSPKRGQACMKQV